MGMSFRFRPRDRCGVPSAGAAQAGVLSSGVKGRIMRFMLGIIGLTVVGLVGSAADAQNIIANSGFETPSGAGPTSLTAVGVSGPSAAASWTVYQNTAGPTTTALSPSTDTVLPGGTAQLDIATGGDGNGAYQFPGTFNYAAADFYVTSGVAQLLITNNFGATRAVATTTVLNQWQRLSVAYAFANEIVLYSFGSGASFSVDNVYAGLTPDPAAVPEPATWALMLGGFGLAGATLRRRQITIVAA